ncbi:flightin [Tribolium castaneum]|nr:PREDICTED: flightin [Tribolium castaneum]XP_008199784.1 PREDICTED: flightin [Tribolium castaneum]XP_969293.1 PREDICTED: flightin [Tribolium castaneum]|eukprot:XP_008199783.1 PREDICTED: flightin [Tribolium castaneum]
MDDEGGDWFADAGDDTPAAAEAAPAEAAAAAGGEAPAAEGEAPPEAAEGDKREVAEEEYLDPDKLLLFKHWIRPKFLQYKYLYDYRHNYYDDVIDYLDKRQKGLRRDIPHPQTWAERALRTYNSKINKIERFRNLVEDTKLVTQTKISGSFQIHHSKNYITRRYSSILV